MERSQKPAILRDLEKKMVFLAGPRQAGKTTLACMFEAWSNRFVYLNWDNVDHRGVITSGQGRLADYIGLAELATEPVVVVFDEIHKYGKWKQFLKGFYDTYKEKVRIIVSGSSRLDVYRRGGDSLMGRYFLYRIHPLTLAEILRPVSSDLELSPPVAGEEDVLSRLLDYGGFPEPFLKADKRFSNRWKRLRHDQLFKEDLRDLTRIQELGQVELLGEMIRHQAGQLVNYSTFASKLNLPISTVKRWMAVLYAFYFYFPVRPWQNNVPRTLIKEPKVFLWDWSLVDDRGARIENLIAVHLLKAVHLWTDRGLGEYQLFFLRDKEKREVDFLVTKDKKPWFLVEAKASPERALSKHLVYFMDKVKAPYAFQVVFDGAFVDKDCFSQKGPAIVPAATFLSQLV